MRALLVCNGGGIGDVFVATPVMRALRMRYEHITVLTTRAHLAVVGSQAADDVWSDDMSFLTLVARLRAAKFDAAVVTWATARTAAALALAGIPERVGQTRRVYSRFFTKRIALASELGDHATPWVQMLLNYARALDCDGDPTPVSLVDDTARAGAAALLDELGIGEAPFMILHPTRGISRERDAWPSSALARVGTALIERFNLPLLISGGAGESESAGGIARRTGGISIAGRTSLAQFAALAERSRLVAAMDSGPMHVAAAAGAPTVGIFAMRPDEPDRWHPIGPRTAVVRCAYPCPAWHTKERCPNFACIRDLDAGRIVAAAAGLLNAEHEHGR